MGLTVDEVNRKSQHKRDALVANKETKFHSAIREYGWDSFIYGVIEVVYHQESAAILEEHYINELNTIKDGYNTHSGGGVGRPTVKRLRPDKYRLTTVDGEIITTKSLSKYARENNIEPYRLSFLFRGLSTLPVDNIIKVERTDGTIPKRKVERGDSSRVCVWKIVYEDNRIEIVENLNQYCKKRGIGTSNVYALAKGRLGRAYDIVSVRKIGGRNTPK